MKSEAIWKNAVITSAEIFADNTYVGFKLILQYGDGQQQVGPHELTLTILQKLLAAADIREWSKIVGRPIRALADPHKDVFAIKPFLAETPVVELTT